MVRPPRLRHVPAAVACTTVLVLGALPTAAASAATPAASRFAMQATGTAAAYMPQYIFCGYDYIELIHNGAKIAVCSLDKTNLYAGSDYPLPLSGIINHSQVRLWLHQNADGTGWSLCVSGETSVALPEAYENPGNIYISADRTPC